MYKVEPNFIHFSFDLWSKSKNNNKFQKNCNRNLKIMNIYENKHKICEETEKKNLFHSKVFFMIFHFLLHPLKVLKAFFMGKKTKKWKMKSIWVSLRNNEHGLCNKKWIRKLNTCNKLFLSSYLIFHLPFYRNVSTHFH